MENQLKTLIQKIQTGAISHESAARELKNQQSEFQKNYRSQAKHPEPGYGATLPAKEANTIPVDKSIRIQLIEAASRILMVNPGDIESDVAWFDLGMDTVLQSGFAQMLLNDYQVTVSLKHLADYPTIESLAEFLTPKPQDFSKEPVPQQIIPEVPAKKEIAPKNPSDDDTVREKAIDYFKNIVARISKLSPAQIDADSPMEKYGINSIMVIQLTEELERTFGRLSKTLFFEYQTTQALAEYFLSAHKKEIREFLGMSTSNTATKDNSHSVTVAGAQSPMSNSRIKNRRFSAKNTANDEKLPGRQEGIAIIGLAGRYPKSSNIWEFWENLKNGKDCITEIPKERWDYSRYFDPDKNKPGKIYSKWGGFIDDADKFDAMFFNISPREAIKIDPQERLFLQCVYETLEDAGYTRQMLHSSDFINIPGMVGVFAGVMYEEYQLLGVQETLLGRPVALAGNPSSIANRVSYFFNFNGPSMAVDTMCSSSLTAIHLACQSLLLGECSMAIAGGVNISIHPNKYLGLSQGKFISSQGRCESFGQGGDGYVPGEGVGAVLLKPLSEAIASGDQIYGIIRSSAINHGGKTNGYTVPNPNAQAVLIASALKKSGVDPCSISYIEAHGTGTSLGDPIEIAGLVKAYSSKEKQTFDVHRCAIGSVKSNIGHLESAAGIAGLTKVLLQMKYGYLVPSLHVDVLNPNINFEETPFRVQRTLTPWERPVLAIHGKSMEYPRIAGISAFGAGGSNAHLIVEEYITTESSQSRVVMADGQSTIFVLSAKNLERLLEQAACLLEFFDDGGYDQGIMADIAYTLQTGREPMETRLAIIAASTQELSEKLKAFIHNEMMPGMHQGQVNLSTGKLSVFNEDEDLQQAVTAWIHKRKYNKLAELWVQGLPVDWRKLYGESQPRRISLTTYPFAKERYWAADVCSGNIMKADGQKIHPLLHENTSDVSGLQFTSVFSLDDFFVKDHVFGGKNILPGVVYLEIARAAAMQAIKNTNGHTYGIQLENIVWTVPLILSDPQTIVKIILNPLDAAQIDYSICSILLGKTETIKHCQGRIVLCKLNLPEKADMAVLQTRCSGYKLSSTDFYDKFKSLRITYGYSLQGVSELYGNAGEILAKLQLPDSVADTQGQYLLHPSLMDAALQAVLALELREIGSHNTVECSNLSPAFPFTLDKLEIYRSCSSAMWAWIRKSNDGNLNCNNSKINIDLMDNEGNLCVKLFGFTTRRQPSDKNTEGLLFLEPVWEAVSPSKISLNASEITTQRVVLIGFDNVDCRLVESKLSNSVCHQIAMPENGLDTCFLFAVTEIVEYIQHVMKEKHSGKILFQVVVPGEKQKPLYRGLSGLIKTIRRECPQIITQLILTQTELGISEIVSIIQECSNCPEDEFFRYNKNGREVARFVELLPVSSGEMIPWKDNGVYLITGGCGRLGYIFAKEIIRKTKNTTIVITGRSSLSPDKASRLDILRSYGVVIDYYQIDVSQKKDVDTIIQYCLDKYGCLNGIIHSAGIIADGLIAGKTNADIAKVLAPKVSGLINLDSASKDIPLDFFILFSSVAGAFGNPGQVDYAAANAFMDAFVPYRRNLSQSGERHGKTLSINWPLWKEGGMRIDPSIEKMIDQKTGMQALETSVGINAFYNAWNQNKDQIIVLSGDETRLRKTFLQSVSSSLQILPSKEINSSDDASVFSSLEASIKKRLATWAGNILAISPDLIGYDAEFYDYGFDSVTFTEFANQLNQEYDLALSPTIFFEHTTLNRLSGYLIANHKQRLNNHLNISQNQPDRNDSPNEEKKNVPEKISPAFWSKSASESLPQKIKTGESAVAIVGMSGRFPKAKDIDEFWQNLLDGRDCIEEIPLSRWDWRSMSGINGKESVDNPAKWGGFINGIDEFDPLFFGISPREALLMDPQQRLLMMYAWKAIEDAGYAPGSLSGSNTGIFVATTGSGYKDLVAKSGGSSESYSATGSVPSIGPSRMSYLLNLHGPSEPIETACSSSLVAIHRAVSSITNGDCDMAISGGINTLLIPETFESFSKAGMLSKDGRCKPFSNKANGYVRGEGVGMFFLKRLKDAEEAGDSIYAVIRGSAVNHGGRAGSLTAPNPVAQAELLKQTYQRSGIDICTIGYIESHGTGTELGDPIEVEALKRAHNELNSNRKTNGNRCGIGSVKKQYRTSGVGGWSRRCDQGAIAIAA